MQKNLIIALVFAIFVAIFSIQNAGPVSLAFFNWQFSISLVVVVLGSAVLGALIMWIIGSFKQLRLKKQKRNLINEKEKLKEEKIILEDELEELKKRHMEELDKKEKNRVVDNNGPDQFKED